MTRIAETGSHCPRKITALSASYTVVSLHSGRFCLNKKRQKFECTRGVGVGVGGQPYVPPGKHPWSELFPLISRVRVRLGLTLTLTWGNIDLGENGPGGK